MSVANQMSEIKGLLFFQGMEDLYDVLWEMIQSKKMTMLNLKRTKYGSTDGSVVQITTFQNFKRFDTLSFSSYQKENEYLIRVASELDRGLIFYDSAYAAFSERKHIAIMFMDAHVLQNYLKENHELYCPDGLIHGMSMC